MSNETEVMAALERAERSGRPLSTQQVARLLGVQPSNAGYLMRRLEREAKVRRAPAPDDELPDRRAVWWERCRSPRCEGCQGRGWRTSSNGRREQCTDCLGLGRSVTAAEREDHRRWRDEVVAYAEEEG
jgi:hypothetical protein